MRSVPLFSPWILKGSQLVLPLAFPFVPTSGVAVTKEQTREQTVRVFTPKGLPERAPVLLFFHGGGFGYPAAPHHKQLAAELSKRVGCRVVMPEYRLLPKFPYPAARENAEAAWDWAQKRFPGQRMGLVGDSAGGTLAVYIALKAGSVPVMLLYPVLDGEMETDSMKRYTDTPMWNARNDRKMWEMYRVGAELSECSPMEQSLPRGPVYLETAELDCLHDEGIRYAERLIRAGIPLELHETSGTVHGYDVARKSRVVRECMVKRVRWLRKNLE